jgi:tetratricopeptide (TPR) repeat protein
VKINSSALNTYLYLREYDKFIDSLPKTGLLPFHIFYRGFAEFHQSRLEQSVQDFNRAFELDPELLQAQIGKALSYSVSLEKAKGLEILRAAESKIQSRGVGDSEAIYKLAQAYAVLGDRASALRMLKHSIDNGFFPYPYFVSDPLLEGMRTEPQFQEILQTANKRYEAFKKTFF